MTKSNTLTKILIKAKKSVYGDMMGNTITKLKGDGYDFSELREYQYGDDVKKISWNTSAKTRKLYVKIFHPGRELNINIASLLGGSVFFGSKILKQDVIAHICAILAYSSCVGGDSYSSFICGNSVELSTKKTKKMVGVKFVTQNILTFNALEQQIEYANLAKNLGEKLKRKSVLFLVGDFMFANKLELSILSKKHDIVLIIVRDKLEENFAKLDNLSLKDPTSYNIINSISNKKLIKNYQQQIIKNDTELFISLKKLGIKFIKIYTHQEPSIILKKLFI